MRYLAPNNLLSKKNRYGRLDRAFQVTGGQTFAIRKGHSRTSATPRYYITEVKAGGRGLSERRAGEVAFNVEKGRILLRDLKTEPAYRRRGVASTLLALMEEEAGKAGVKEIQGVNPSKMAKGCKYYQQFGYKIKKLPGYVDYYCVLDLTKPRRAKPQVFIRGQ